MAWNITFAVLAALLFSLQINALPHGEPDECVHACPFSHDPVCGFDGVEMKTFPNECELEYAVCSQFKDFRIVNKGECNTEAEANAESKNCPSCHKMYAPVCGSDGKEHKTFSNKCKMDETNCRQSREFKQIRAGPCNNEEEEAEKPKGKNCKPCTKIYKPVCGKEGSTTKTFSNECMMVFHNCMESSDFKLVRTGKC